jgi:hypothetical protein
VITSSPTEFSSSSIFSMLTRIDPPSLAAADGAPRSGRGSRLGAGGIVLGSERRINRWRRFDHGR